MSLEDTWGLSWKERPEVRKAIVEGLAVSDEYCGAWCKPIHFLIEQVGRKTEELKSQNGDIHA